MWSDVAKAFSAGSSCTKEYKHGADVFVDCDEAFIHTNAEEDGGGLACSDVELINSQRRIIIDIGKQLGRKLLSGDLNLINISLPVVMFEPRSYLQKLADPWVHPIHLEKAAACRNPLERMKLTVTWFVAGLQHVFCSWRKPFNPLLGETWQAHLPSGTKIFTEQVSHHPPVTAFHMDGRAGLYTFDGLSQPQVSFNSGGLKTSARGYRRITFAADGAVITIKYPHYKIAGLISGVPRGLIRGTATLTDNKHNITATVTFGPVAGAASRLLNRADSLHVAITGPAAAAAAEIPVPEWIEAVGAERPVSAAADGALIAHDTAAAAAAALLAPVQQTRGNCVQSQRACSLPAACNESFAQEMHYSNGTTQQLKNSNLSVSSSTCSQDCYMVIDSMQRSNSSNSVISLDWLAKPGKKLGRVGRGTGSSGGGNGNHQKSSRHRHSTPGLRLGSCFGSFQVNPSHEDSSSSRSRSVSPGVSRVQSSTACCLADDSFHALHPSIPSHTAAAQHACLDASGVPADSNGVYPADATHSSTATAQHGGKESAVADGLVQLEDNRDTFATQHTAPVIKPQPSLDLPRQECSAQQQGSAVKDTLLPSQETPTAHKLQEKQQQRQQKHRSGYAQQPQQLLVTGCGNWLSHLDFDDQRYWTLTEDPPEHWVSLHDCQPGQQHEPNSQQLHAIGQEDQQQVAGKGFHQHTHPTHLSSTDQCTLISHQDSQPVSQPHHQHHQDIKDKICALTVLLPSDSQLRADLAAFRAGDSQAQQVKEELEQQQRQDAKLRPSFQHRDCAQAD